VYPYPNNPVHTSTHKAVEEGGGGGGGAVFAIRNTDEEEGEEEEEEEFFGGERLESGGEVRGGVRMPSIGRTDRLSEWIPWSMVSGEAWSCREKLGGDM